MIQFNAQILATVLLAMRVVAVILIVAVLVRQISNIRHLQTKYPVVRTTVLILTIVLLIGQFVPIALDGVVAFGNFYPGRNQHPNELAAAYSLSNASKDMVIGALLVFLHYRPGSNKS